MRNFWEKIKGFFMKIWDGLTVAGRIILGFIIVAAIGLASYLIIDNSKDDSGNNESTPEIAQVFEPSIGTPLPPDNSNQEGQVGGATTNEPSTPSTPTTETPTTNYVAPNAGVNDADPIKYNNQDLKFAAVLPAYSQVNEQNDRVQFSSQNGSLQYLVSVNNAGSETIESIESQLRNSPSASNITHTTFGNSKALKFTAKGYGTGIVFVANGKIYYLLGNSQYFTDFKLI